MNKFEMLKTFDVDDLADFLNSIESTEDAPWNKWFNAEYCNSEKCPSIICKCIDKTCECAYCELYKKENGEGKCRFFPNKDILGSGNDIVKIWLESDVVDNIMKM